MMAVEPRVVDEFWENTRDQKSRDSRWKHVYDYGIANAGKVVEVELPDLKEARRLSLALRAVRGIEIDLVQKKGKTIRFRVAASDGNTD